MTTNGLGAQDVINCYRLALGREPESDEVIEDKLRQPRASLLPAFFSSGEFNENIRSKVLGAIPLGGDVFGSGPSDELRSWTARFAPLTPAGAEAAGTAPSWARLYHALFSDPVFVQTVLDEEARSANPAFLVGLEHGDQVQRLGQIVGQVDLVTPSEIRGWAVDMRNPDRRLTLELLVEGVSSGMTRTALYRPDLQARFGGDGRVGFVLPRAAGAEQRWGAAALRDSATGANLQRLRLSPPQSPPLDAALALRRELADLRELLRRIETRLPDFAEAFAFSLENYDAYAATYYPALPELPAPRPSTDLSIIVDATDTSLAALDRTLAHLARQESAPVDVVVMHAGGQQRLELTSCLQDWRRKLGPTELSDVSADGGTWSRACLQAVEAARSEHILLLGHGAYLAPDAAALFGEALRTGAALVYADADRVEIDRDSRTGRRFDPEFRTDFDLDLLLQGLDLGDVLGVSRSRLLELGLRSEYGNEAVFDLTLRCLERLGAPAISHIPRVLVHAEHRPRSAVDGPPPARLAAVRDHLERTGVAAAVEAHADALGARVPAALRVRRAIPLRTRAAVVVPTRDRLDLLGPCLASLSAAAVSNRVEMELIVVDNQSTAAATRVFLDSYSRLSALRVLEHDGAFNWALMNNRAAKATDADVLIFLNNDTVVATPDWCDELCSQALRPDVGAVGARLLYEDGAIQHAGMVVGGWHAFAAHEGMGSPGASAGYLGRHALVRQVSVVTGACLATRADVFRQFGGFDAVAFPVEANDADYCLRVRAAGLKVIYTPGCTLYHFESKSRGYNLDPERRAQAEAAGAELRARWGEAFRLDPFYNPHFDRLSAPLTRLRPPPSPVRPNG